MAKQYGIHDKLPILIAEKMGPHFAVGDTCYSWAEDTKVYNPDGKEIIARDNEISLLRKEDPGKAYFGCHTDITIPYEELGSICVIRIKRWRFCNNVKEDLLMMKGEKIKNSTELEFVIFCIENVAVRLGVDAECVYQAFTEKSDILNGYIVPEYEALHTQSREYIVDDLLDVMKERGVEV